MYLLIIYLSMSLIVYQVVKSICNNLLDGDQGSLRHFHQQVHVLLCLLQLFGNHLHECL
jgi:hypothetical protein